MNKFTFTNPVTGQVFEVETPASFTEAQARQIFQQQLDAGSLVGLRAGDVINSTTQLAGGLSSAAGQVGQTLTGVAGSATGALSGALDKAKQAASALPNRDLLSAAQSLASKSLSGINTVITNLVPANPINIADLARQAGSLVPIQGLSQVDVRSALSQVSKLVGQAADVVSDSKGVGKFGFDAVQLERAGVVKPGTASTYLSSGTANLSTVLNSPAVWTGVDGITSVDKLLTSVPAQDRIQQQLMSQGLNTVKNLGIPTDKLNPSGLAGVALNAAKTVSGTMSWAQGLPLATVIKNNLDTVARAGAFAVGFSSKVANDAVLQQDPAAPAVDTANRVTIDAAVTRVTGNDKIPEVNYQSIAVQVTQGEFERTIRGQLQEANARYQDLINQAQTLTAASGSASQARNDPARLRSELDTWQQILGDLTADHSNVQAQIREVKSFESKFKIDLGLLSLLEALSNNIDSWIKNLETIIASRQQKLEASAIASAGQR